MLPGLLAILVGATVAACSKGVNTDRPDAGSALSTAHQDFGNPEPPPVDAGTDAGQSAQRPGADAFFIMDDPPPYCGPDGERQDPKPPGGTDECPADKNREGCECPEAGMDAACWPGRRKNRNHGICEDGVTRCIDSPEFGKHWGPCDGYVLPEEGVLSGPAACRCFSNGEWKFDNLVPCPISRDDSGPLYFYSSHLDDKGVPICDMLGDLPPAAPTTAWSQSLLNVDCAGRFELCYTIKAGSKEDPKEDDCVVTRQCVDVWYAEAGTDMPIEVPGWASDDGACGRAFRDSGGYGEMSVRGLSIECDDIDDGQGEPLIFFRTSYCPADCSERPDDDAECRDCQTGGEGGFEG